MFFGWGWFDSFCLIIVGWANGCGATMGEMMVMNDVKFI
jgi:hypothetical protein